MFDKMFFIATGPNLIALLTDYTKNDRQRYPYFFRDIIWEGIEKNTTSLEAISFRYQLRSLVITFFFCFFFLLRAIQQSKLYKILVLNTKTVGMYKSIETLSSIYVFRRINPRKHAFNVYYKSAVKYKTLIS